MEQCFYAESLEEAVPYASRVSIRESRMFPAAYGTRKHITPEKIVFYLCDIVSIDKRSISARKIIRRCISIDRLTKRIDNDSKLVLYSAIRGDNG